MVAAHTTHGLYSAAGAPERAMRRYAWTVVARIKLLADATRLQPDLPDGMGELLEDYPVELRAPKHPSQVAFEAALTRTPCNSGPPGPSGQDLMSVSGPEGVTRLVMY
jgi:hypothetical protein